MRRTITAAGVIIGLVCELVAFGWNEPEFWVPDLVTGLAFLWASGRVWERRRAVGILLAGTGLAWFAGSVVPELLFLHRGPLAHLLLAHPGWRARGPVRRMAICSGYLAALAAPLWEAPAANLVLATVIVGLVLRQGTAHRRTVLLASTAYASVLLAGTVSRLVFPDGEAAVLAYEAVLCGIAVALSSPTGSGFADLVVELGETRSSMLQDALADALGDPLLRVGYWLAGTGGFIDVRGRPLSLPPPDGDLYATKVERDGLPFAVIVHDRALLADPELAQGVAVATRLTAANAALQTQTAAKAAEVSASRRRLLLAADHERARLERRLRDGPVERLISVQDRLLGLSEDAANRHLTAAVEQLTLLREELDALERGLRPRELDQGGRPALEALAARCPVPVRLTAPGGRFPAEVETAVYYLCAEALANLVKHAAATTASIQVERSDDGLLTVLVTDDGRGGAVPTAGGGITGLADRIETIGGCLRVESPPGGGTRLVAELPVGHHGG